MYNFHTADFNLSVTLRDIGYRWPTRHTWLRRAWSPPQFFRTPAAEALSRENGVELYPAPSLEDIARWLAQERDVYVFVTPVYNLDYTAKLGYCWRWEHKRVCVRNGHEYRNYNEALNAAIKDAVEDLK